MIWSDFHHPDWCPTVIRRRLAEDLFSMIAETSVILLTRPRPLWRSYYPTDTAYRNAMCRLHKSGLIAYCPAGGKMPVLQLTPAGETRVSPACQRRPPWPRSWHGFWYLLTYDVPETNRSYRDVLRIFFRKTRMGCLQKSVWVTPTDIRPVFDDLTRAAGVNTFAFLFESRTVLGRSSQDVVEAAWGMNRVREQQQWYLEIVRENMDRMETSRPSPESLHTVAREELSAYMTVMNSDPFLPRPLWPPDYLGEQAWILHREFHHRIASLL